MYHTAVLTVVISCCILHPYYLSYNRKLAPFDHLPLVCPLPTPTAGNRKSELSLKEFGVVGITVSHCLLSTADRQLSQVFYNCV